MRLRWIREKLQRWAAWRDGLGKIKGIQLGQVGGVSMLANDAGLKIDEDSVFVDQVIQSLPTEHQEIILKVYCETNGDLDKAAEKMSLNRRTVSRKIFEAEREFAVKYDEKSMGTTYSS